MKSTSTIPTREAWLQERRRGIGGSEASAVLGLSPWKSALELYCDKIGIGSPEFDEPEYIQWGRILEPVIAQKYRSVTGRRLEPLPEYSLEWSKDYPWMCCTVDGKIDAPEKQGQGVLEIKTGASFKEGEWRDEPPVEYQIQMQHNLVVTGLRWGSFAVLLGGQKFLWCDVTRNDRFCSYMIDEERKFWERVLAQDPPAPGKPFDSAAGALARLYPGEEIESVALDGAIQECAEALETLKADKKKIEEEIAEKETRIRAAIGAAGIGVCPNGMSFSLKTVKRSGYTVEPTEFRQLRRLKTR